MALSQDYHELWFESFDLPDTGGHRDPVALRLTPGQELPEEVEAECERRSLNPLSLLLECNKDLFYNYPVGTRFLLKAKLTDREGKGTFFYTSYRWQPIDLVEPKGKRR